MDISNYNYTTDEKMQGLDLYGLPCRVPTPDEKQSKCSHTRKEWVQTGYRDDFSDEWIDLGEELHESWAYEDIPGTHLLKCSICGYTRRY
jgi:hypothetical protein